MNDNVVKLPRNMEDFRPITKQDVDDSIESIRELHCDDVSDVIMEAFFRYSFAGGFDFPDDELFLKDLAMLLQTIRSILMKHHGLYHPLQELAQERFDANSEGVVTMKVTAAESQGTT